MKRELEQEKEEVGDEKGEEGMKCSRRKQRKNIQRREEGGGSGTG